MNESNVLIYKGYLGQVEFDSEAKIFYGRVVNIRDTITFQSENAQQLETEFHLSIDTYIDFCQEMGQSPEDPFSGRFAIQIRPELHYQVALKAAHHQVAMDAYIQDVLEKAVVGAL